MRWSVLGPVQAARQRQTVPLTRPQQKAVLAYLLLNANAVVSTRQLTDALWGGSPPATARTQIHTYISHIRRALRTVDAEDRLASQAGGYKIAVGEGELDVAEFDKHVRLARVAAAEGRTAEAVELMQEGLAQWRGSPLTGAAGEFVLAASTGLEEQRLSAHEDLADARIALSQYGSVASELRPLAAAHPMRERLVGQLMTALAGSGQQAEALRLYAHTRERLSEELGVEPGAGLARVHLRVLRQQVSVPDEVLPDAESDRPRPPRPAQLPADIAGFVGRDAYLDQLDRIMVEGHDPSSTAAVIVALEGDAGVGKSTLAMHWAHRVADKFTDGQLYADLRGFDPSGEAANPAETVREFLDALGVSPERVPAGVQAQAALYRSLLAERRMLIVLDNARDVDQVRILLPGAPACLALVTSRNRIPGLLVADAARPLTLDLMGDAEARELLSLRIGADRVLAEPAAVDEIIDVCAGLPLALAVVAARVAARPDFPLAELANQLSRAEHRLDTLSGGDKVTDLRNVFSWSYRALSPDASRLFRLLSLHPGPDVAAPAAASAAGVPIKKVTPLLAELSRLHLIGEHNYHRYAFHDLLRVYADELAHEHDSDDNRHEARRRMLDHYLHSAYAMDLLLIPHRDRVELPEPCPGVTPELPTDREHALDWFKAECTALKASVHRAVDAGFDRHAWQLSLITGTFYDRQGLWRDWLPTQETALRAAQRLGDRTGEAYTCLHLATSHLRLRRIDEAFDLGRRALDIFENVGHQRGAALAHHILGLLLDRQERFRDALVHDWQAHNLYRAVGHRFGQARELNSIGWHHALLGDFRRTLVYCEQAVAIQQDVDDLYGQAASWDSLGFAHHRLGRHRQAITCYQNALDLCHRIDDRYSKAITLGRLGDAYRGAGDLADAHDAWREAVGILDDLGNPEADQIRAKLQEG